jgi:hypothetical protein
MFPGQHKLICLFPQSIQNPIRFSNIVAFFYFGHGRCLKGSELRYVMEESQTTGSQQSQDRQVSDEEGSASTHRTMSPERCSSFRICQPAFLIFPIVRGLILAPIIRTIMGLTISNNRPNSTLPGLMCSRSKSFPLGLQTLLSSFNPATGSGTEQKTNVANTVSKILFGNASCCTSMF